MYEMSQRHPVWVAENHVNPCNSALYCSAVRKIYCTAPPPMWEGHCKGWALKHMYIIVIYGPMI